jgi:Protein of unknown function (DUF551)
LELIAKRVGYTNQDEGLINFIVSRLATPASTARTDGWVSVEERLPEKYTTVLVLRNGEAHIQEFCYDGEGCGGTHQNHKDCDCGNWWWCEPYGDGNIDENWVFIYFTHMLFLCAIFAIFLLSATRAYATSEVGPRSGVSRNAALTTNHLHEKGDSWLSLSVPNPLSASTSFPRQKARSLPTWNCLSHPITTSLKSFFRTRPLSLSILNPASKSLQNLSVGSLENITRSNAGDLFTALSNISNIKPEPAERRVLLRELCIFGWATNNKFISNGTVKETESSLVHWFRFENIAILNPTVYPSPQLVFANPLEPIIADITDIGRHKKILWMPIIASAQYAFLRKFSNQCITWLFGKIFASLKDSANEFEVYKVGRGSPAIVDAKRKQGVSFFFPFTYYLRSFGSNNRLRVQLGCFGIFSGIRSLFFNSPQGYERNSGIESGNNNIDSGKGSHYFLKACHRAYLGFFFLLFGFGVSLWCASLLDRNNFLGSAVAAILAFGSAFCGMLLLISIRHM